MDQFPDQNNTPHHGEEQKNRTTPILIAGFIVLALGFLAGWLLGNQKPVDPFQSIVPPVTSQGTNGNEVQAPANWSKLTMIKDQIYEIYDGPIDENAMLEGAIKGMVDSLGDPYSQFYNAEEYSELNSDSTGKFVGVGIQINVQNDEIVVVAPIDGSPAKEAGIMSGDVIVRVDGKVYTGKDMNEAVDYMRGEVGDPVTLTIRRNEEEIDFEIIRREITTKSVRYEMLADDMGLITVSQFTQNVDKDFKKALDQLSADGAKGFILDLRGNPGGYLQESIRMASNFIPENQIVVSTIDKHGNRQEDLSKGGDYIGTPLVVLVDVGSASASEVVAGALKDYDAATLVGQKTYGKGIVQTIMDLDGGEGLKLTVASYYSPKGTNIHQIGISPDINIAYPDDIPAVDYSQEKDTQLQKAIEVLQEKLEQAD